MEQNNSIFDNLEQSNDAIQTDIKDHVTVYYVMSAESDTEFYSYNLPEIESGHITLRSPFEKGEISEEILDQVVQEFYKKETHVAQQSFSLLSGVIIKEYNEDALDWINMKVEDAKAIIKDKIITKYQQVVPALMNKLNVIETRMKQGQNKKQQESIIDL